MRTYLKEEAFVDEYERWAWAASKAVGGDWRPNADCSDATRKQNEYFMSTGQMTWLVFTFASVRNDPGDEVHALIVLESSTRLVNIRAFTRSNVAEATILFDRPK